MDDLRQQLTEAAAEGSKAFFSNVLDEGLDEELAAEIVDRLWPIIEGLVEVATTEGRRQAAEAIEALYETSGVLRAQRVIRAYFCGVDDAVAAARGEGIYTPHGFVGAPIAAPGGPAGEA